MTSSAMAASLFRTAPLRRAKPAHAPRRQEKVWDWVWGAPHRLLPDRIRFAVSRGAAVDRKMAAGTRTGQPGRGRGADHRSGRRRSCPALSTPWLDAFRNSPGRFLIGVLLVGELMVVGGWMQGHIRDLMRAIWRTPGASATRPDGIVYRIRSAGPYRALLLCAQILDFADLFRGSDLRLAAGRGDHAAQPGVVYARSIWPGGCVLRARIRRRGTVTGVATDPIRNQDTVLGDRARRGKEQVLPDHPRRDRSLGRWSCSSIEPDPDKAKGIETGPRGFGWERMTSAMMLGLPLRRLLAVELVRDHSSDRQHRSRRGRASI